MPSSTTSSESPSRRLSDFDVRATTTIRSAWLPPVMKVFDPLSTQPLPGGVALNRGAGAGWVTPPGARRVA
jgi:hypothetical protein